VAFPSLEERIDPGFVARAQQALETQRRGAMAPEGRDEVTEVEDEADEVDEEREKSVVVGELLAFFPGLFVHGLGHYYAGDHVTARKLRGMGEWGYLLTAVGGGILVGAYFLDQSSDDILPISLYVAGGTVGAVGLGYFFTAWVGDMYDTPRAVQSGGKPWRFLMDDAGAFD
jgi:hypothetical protein